MGDGDEFELFWLGLLLICVTFELQCAVLVFQHVAYGLWVGQDEFKPEYAQRECQYAFVAEREEDTEIAVWELQYNVEYGVGLGCVFLAFWADDGEVGEGTDEE